MEEKNTKEKNQEIQYLTEKLNSLTDNDPMTISKRRVIREQLAKLKEGN